MVKFGRQSATVVSGAKTATFTSSAFSTEGATRLLGFLTTTAAGGTSPTLNMRLQTLAPDNTTWCDIASLAQITGNATTLLGYQATGPQEFAITDGSLAAGTIKTVPLGTMCRWKGTIGGTNPTFTVVLQHILME